MKSVFLFHNYIEFLTDLVHLGEERGHKRVQLAKAMSCQATDRKSVV